MNRNGIKRKIPPKDAKQHLFGDCAEDDLIVNLREEISTLREALVRTHTIRIKLEDVLRETKEELIVKGDKELAYTLTIPSVDPFVAEVVERALIIDSGRTCENSCEYGYCIGSVCPLYAVKD